MRRASFITNKLSQSEEELLDENGNFGSFGMVNRQDHLLPPGGLGAACGVGLTNSQSFSSFWSPNKNSLASSTTGNGMTSRPSFISLMLIASDDELSRLPRLPAPLQVETDTYQKMGWDDEPKVCSHLPVLHPPSENSSDDDEEHPHGIMQKIIHLPERIRKISADKQRFNVFALPDQDRKQLKNLVVY